MYPESRSFVEIAYRVITNLGLGAVEMSEFIAREVSPVQYCRELVRASDIYVAIIGFKYGTVVPDESPEASFTELEYNEARATGLPCLVFLLDDAAPVPRSLVDIDARKIEDFRKRLLESNVTVAKFRNGKDFSALLHDSLQNLIDSSNESLPLRTTVVNQYRPWMVPNFGQIVDRPEISQKLLKLLLEPDTSAVGITTAIEGAGGFGKTTLAALVCKAEALRERYAGGLIWLTIGEDLSGSALAELANSATEIISSTRPSTSDPLVAGAMLGEAMDASDGVLMVLDDVWFSDQLAPFMIGGANSRRLVTTRNRNVLPRGAKSFLVDAMQDDQATKLLTMGLGKLPLGIIIKLMDITGRWPVLLGLINASILENVKLGATVEEAANWAISKLAQDGPAALDIRYPSSRAQAVTATMKVSLDQLEPEERRRYLELAVFPEDAAIPRMLLRFLWTSGDRLPSPEDVASTISKANHLRLIVGRWEGAGPTFTLHDVVRNYLRSEIGADGLIELNLKFITKIGEYTLHSDDDIHGRDWWDLSDSETYLWRYLCWHLSESSNFSELERVACDLRWISKKTRLFSGVAAASSDLALVPGVLAETLFCWLGAQSSPIDSNRAVLLT